MGRPKGKTINRGGVLSLAARYHHTLAFVLIQSSGALIGIATLQKHGNQALQDDKEFSYFKFLIPQLLKNNKVI